MENRFRLLNLLGLFFKVAGWVLFIVIGLIGTVAILTGSEMAQSTPKWGVVFTLLTGAFWLVVFYTIGEVIKLLLAIEERTRRS